MADLTDFDTPPVILTEDDGKVTLEDWQPGWYIPWVGEAAAAGQAAAKRSGGVPHMAINKGVW